MSGQFDMFQVLPVCDRSDTSAASWCRRMLRDLAAGPRVYCYPGFLGAACEILVDRGLASREPLGDLPRPDDLPKKLWKWWAESGPRPQFRYAITAFGRAHLEAA